MSPFGYSTDAPKGDQLLLSDLMKLLWRRRGLIVLFSLLAFGLTAIAIFFVQPKYRAIVTVVEKQDETTQGSGISLSGGLASIGSSLLGGRPALSVNYQQFLDLLTEPSTLSQLPNYNAILRTIYRSEWNVRENNWDVHNGLVTSINKFFGLPDKQAPDSRQLSETLKKLITVAPLETGPLYQISITWPDPNFATMLLSSLIKGADDTLRMRRAAELQARELYLSTKLGQISAVEERQALSQILGQTILSQAVLYQTPHYSVEIVQPATASATPVSPVPLLYLLFAIIGGATLGCIAIFAAALATGTHPADSASKRADSWVAKTAERFHLPI